MKKVLILMLVALLFLIPSTSLGARNGGWVEFHGQNHYYSEISSIRLNGKTVDADVRPIVVEGRTLIPARFLLEALGMQVGWNEKTQIVTAEKEGVKLNLVANGDGGERENTYNGIEYWIDGVPPLILNNRTYVPVRMVSQMMGLNVKWDGYNQRVLLTEPESKPALTIEDAHWLLKQAFPHATKEKGAIYTYLPLGGYASQDQYAIDNYYFFVIRTERITGDINQCVNKNTGIVRGYDALGFFDELISAADEY